MELIIGIIVLGGIAYVAYSYFNREKSDGSHPLDAVTPAPYKVEAPTSALDVNKDGKVDLEDAKEAVKKVKSQAKKATGKAKETVKKATSRGRKPKA